MIEEYFEAIRTLLQSLSLSASPKVDYDYRDRDTGFLKGDLLFKDGSRLHFREFVHVKLGKPIDRYMYVFQYMQPNGTTIFRYDDSDHFPHLPTTPHHKHVGDNEVVASDEPDLQSVLKEIEKLIET